jgi:hypothetical protein
MRPSSFCDDQMIGLPRLWRPAPITLSAPAFGGASISAILSSAIASLRFGSRSANAALAAYPVDHPGACPKRRRFRGR